MSQALKSIILILLALLLPACGLTTPEPFGMATEARTSGPIPVSPTPAPSHIATRTLGFAPASPTSTSTETAPPSAATSTPALPTSTAPQGLRIAYVIEGNLYLQDGGNPPVQLTHNGEDSHPVFSDDGERIAFFRGVVPHDLYAINGDRSGERALVTNEMLLALGQGHVDLSEVGTLSFIPGSHRLFFNTHQLNSGGYTINNRDLLLVDTDTGEFRSLFPPGPVGGFKVSPDGKLVAINMSGHVDILTTNGQVVRRNLVTYTPTRPDELFPDLFWVPDSTELIVILPAETEYEEMGAGPPTFTVWRYALDGSAAVQVPLDSLPKGYSLPSPDGNWIIYDYLDNSVPIFELYIGNLHDGSTRVYSTETVSAHWGPDSRNIILQGGKVLFLGTLDNLPVPIDRDVFWAGSMPAAICISISQVGRL